MYKNHVTEEIRSSDGRDTDVHKESKDQRKYLESTLDQVTQKLQKSYETFAQSSKKIMKENVYLLVEINNLKTEKHKLDIQIK